MMKNFINGSLVMRVWRFDGSGEVLGKFQYFRDAMLFAERVFEKDREDGRDLSDFFYLAVCDSECEVKAFGVKMEAINATDK